jgi:hypothetical protein
MTKFKTVGDTSLKTSQYQRLTIVCGINCAASIASLFLSLITPMKLRLIPSFISPVFAGMAARYFYAAEKKKDYLAVEKRAAQDRHAFYVANHNGYCIGLIEDYFGNLSEEDEFGLSESEAQTSVQSTLPPIEISNRKRQSALAKINTN